MPFARLVKELCQDSFTKPGEAFRWQPGAIEAIQAASEDYLVTLLADAYVRRLWACGCVGAFLFFSKKHNKSTGSQTSFSFFVLVFNFVLCAMSL